MFNLEQEDDVLIITLSGKITADEVTAFYQSFETAIEAVDQIGLVIDATGFDDMTGDAIARDISLEFGLMDRMGKLPKAAVVSDKEFIAAAVRAMNPLLPMIEMRSFKSDEMQAARKFAADLPPKKRQGKGIRMMDQSSPEVMGFEIEGYIEADALLAISNDVLRHLEKDEEFRALVKIKSFRGFDPHILTEGSFLKMKLGAMKKTKKYAVVTDEVWVKPLIGIAGSFLGIEARRFPLAQEQAAWDWVRS